MTADKTFNFILWPDKVATLWKKATKAHAPDFETKMTLWFRHKQPCFIRYTHALYRGAIHKLQCLTPPPYEVSVTKFCKIEPNGFIFSKMSKKVQKAHVKSHGV